MPWGPNVWQPFTKMLTNCFWLNCPRFCRPLVHAFSQCCGIAGSPWLWWCYLSNSGLLQQHRVLQGITQISTDCFWHQRGVREGKGTRDFCVCNYIFIYVYTHIHICVCVCLYIHVCLQLYLWECNNQPPKCLLSLCVCKHLEGLLLSWHKLKEQGAFLGLRLWCAVLQTSPILLRSKEGRAGQVVLY